MSEGSYDPFRAFADAIAEKGLEKGEEVAKQLLAGTKDIPGLAGKLMVTAHMTMLMCGLTYIIGRYADSAEDLAAEIELNCDTLRKMAIVNFAEAQEEKRNAG